MDELMMDWLYEELDPARSARVAEHAGGCARCSAELAALRRTREAFRDMPDLEPPPALSAILLHEAARRAPSAEAGAVVVAVPSDGDTGLWARIAAWLRPLALHPAATAACTVVLLAGVAGALYVRGGGEMAAPSHMSSPDLPPPPADTTPAAGGELGGADQTDSAAPARREPLKAELEEAPAEKPAVEDQGRDGYLGGLAAQGAPAGQSGRQPSSYAADLLDDERQADVAAAEGKAPGPATGAVQEQRENKGSSALRAAKSKMAERNAARKGDVGVELDRARDLDDKRRAKLSKDVVPGRDYADPPATPAPSGRLEEPSADPAAAGDAVGTRGPTRGAPPKVSRRAAGRPDDEAVAEPEPAAPPTGAASASTAPAQARTRAQLDWLSAQEGKIAALGRSGKCRELAAVANDILDRDPSYYVLRVQAKVVAGKCQRVVSDETRRRTLRRASKNSGGAQRDVKAAAEESEAADAAERSTESEKAQKR